MESEQPTHYDDEIQQEYVSRRQRQRQSRIALRPPLAPEIDQQDNPAWPNSIGVKTQLLPVLRLLGLYNVRSFSIEADQQWNLRQDLGAGISSSVEGAAIPLSSALSHIRYRSIQYMGLADGTRYVDHTGARWSYGTRVAYKRSNRTLLEIRDIYGPESTVQSVWMENLLMELRVLCHAPLQRHSNIPRLLGIAWIKDQRFDEHETDAGKEWPTIVMENAPYGTLSDLMRSPLYSEARSSLRVKLGLVIDVLAGIAAIHSCGIVHSDIKCANTLVFDADVGQADSWRVKISDFGNAISDLPVTGMIEYEVLGTPFYQAPELDGMPQRVGAETIKATDIWCWGILLWEVMTDGKLQHENQTIDGAGMRQLRASRQVAEVARTNCARVFNELHAHEYYAASQIVLETISAALHSDPMQRPSAENLLTQLRRFVGDK